MGRQIVGNPGTEGFGSGEPGVPDLLAGVAVLAASYAITADATWESTGLELVLPDAGRYQLNGSITGYQLNTTLDASLLARLWDATRGLAVPDSEIRVTGVKANTLMLLTSCLHVPEYRVTRRTVIRLEAQRNAAGAWTASQIFSSAGDSRTRIGFLKIGPGT